MARTGSAVYHLHGLRLRSPVPLAGPSLPSPEFDVDVRLQPPRAIEPGSPPGRVVVVCGSEEAHRYAGAEVGGQLTLRAPSVCDFVVDGGLWTVDCHPAPGTDPRLVALLLGGLVVAFVHALRGDFVLHASAVEVDGRAIAFAGDSGSGKSTLAALICAAGGRLVTDDLLRLGSAPGHICVDGSSRIRLRSTATWAVEEFDSPPPSESTVDDRLAIAPPRPSEAEVALAAVVLPRVSRAASSLDIRPLGPATALPRVMGASRVVGWRDPDVLRRQFQRAGAFVKEVPVMEAVVPWGERLQPSLVPSLIDLTRRQL